MSSVEVKEEGDEEVLVVVSSNEHVVGTIQDFHEKSIVQTPEPETEAAPAPPPSAGGAISGNNNNRVRPNRRRRGARKNDKNRKFPEDEVTKTRSRYEKVYFHFEHTIMFSKRGPKK